MQQNIIIVRIVALTSKFKNLLVGVLLLILSAYYVNSSMFYHSHVIKGETIFHSHFYSKSHTTSSEDGGHDLAMAKLIAALDNIVVEEQSFDSHLETAEREVERVILARSTSKSKLFLERCRSLRAPPIA